MLVNQIIKVLLIRVDVDFSVSPFNDELDFQVDEEMDDFLNTFWQHREPSLVDNEETVNEQLKMSLEKD